MGFVISIDRSLFLERYLKRKAEKIKHTIKHESNKETKESATKDKDKYSYEVGSWSCDASGGSPRTIDVGG